jgi:sterol desaturase/sphingolipid hydroxylase (fatty acid hydroxylase superfamily)
LLDYLLIPVLVAGAFAATAALIDASASAALTTTIVVGGVAGIAAILERIRPERVDYLKLDQPLLIDAAQFVFNYNFGYLVATAFCAWVGRVFLDAAPAPLWPARWPVALQVGLAIFVSEGVSYWQHRWGHRLSTLWRFHSLHHHGASLNITRSARFHFVDSFTAATAVLLPLVLLGTPEAIVTWTIVIYGALGVFQHANIRARTPGWMDRVICTAAVHRFHHSTDLREGGSNFGTTIMFFDVLFGTYVAPYAPGPRTVGIENDPVPEGFFGQTFGKARMLFK